MSLKDHEHSTTPKQSSTEPRIISLFDTDFSDSPQKPNPFQPPSNAMTGIADPMNEYAAANIVRPKPPKLAKQPKPEHYTPRHKRNTLASRTLLALLSVRKP